jgi:hypothetical protein
MAAGVVVCSPYQPGCCLTLVLAAACVLLLQAQDNSQDEVSLTLINLTGETVKAGSTSIVFNLAVATLGSP